MVVGIERTVDDLGRIVIPKEYRKLYDMNEHKKVYVTGTEDGILISRNNFKMTEVEN